MFIVTGAGGFIGFHVAKMLEDDGNEVIIFDHKTVSELKTNYSFLKPKKIYKPDKIFDFINTNYKKIISVIHMGANSSTAEKNLSLLINNNFQYTLDLFQACNKYSIKFIYASSAATYGDGSKGFDDQNSLMNFIKLSPLNYYGLSKHLFDLHVVRLIETRREISSFPIGLKFFNVYGPYELHKGFMSSPIPKFYYEIKKNSKIKLFKSYNPNFKDGMQSRDFVYIKDCISVIKWFLENKRIKGIFNIGSGKSTSFLSLSEIIFKEMGLEIDIKFIDKPKEIREGYQYLTKADIRNLRKVGYTKSFTTLKKGVNEYIENFLNV